MRRLNGLTSLFDIQTTSSTSSTSSWAQTLGPSHVSLTFHQLMMWDIAAVGGARGL